MNFKIDFINLNSNLWYSHSFCKGEVLLVMSNMAKLNLNRLNSGKTEETEYQIL